jgi:hypothetical protein
MLPTNQAAPQAAPLTPADEIMNGVRAHMQIVNARADDGEWQKQKKARLEMIAAARRYYKGYHPPSLKVRPKEKNFNVVINQCRRIVNDSVAWLFGDRNRVDVLDFELQPKTDSEVAVEDDVAGTPDEALSARMAEAEAYLRKVWRENGGARLIQKIGRRTAITGHGFIKVVPVGDQTNPNDWPMIVLQKPELIGVMTRADNDDVLDAYIIEWQEKKPAPGNRTVDVRMRQLIVLHEGQWWIGKFAEGQRGDLGKKEWQEVDAPALWPWAWSPIVDWQNLPNDDGYYGESDLEDLTGLNDALNFVASNTNKILYIHGHPRLFGTGFDASDVQDTAIDAMFTVGEKDAKLQSVEMQGDLKSAFAFLQLIYQAMVTIGRSLDIGSLQDKIGQITNFGLRVLASSALAKLDEKRVTYGEALVKINAMLLELGGYGEFTTEIHWMNPLPDDEGEEVNRLKTEREMGIVSKQSASEERGRDWNKEEERMAKEQLNSTNIGAALLTAFDRGNNPA